MDYNIYIHDKTSGQSKPTQPRTTGGTNTKGKTQETNNGGAVSLLAKKVGSVVAGATTTAGKIAIAIYAAYKVADKVISVIEPFVTRETGDYRFSVAWHNVKATINNFMNPVHSGISHLRYNQEMRLYNEKQEQQRLLIGDSFINSVSRKV